MATSSATVFSAEVSGKTYTFKCSAAPGSHTCVDQDGRKTRYTYGNRPWESFQFETVLSKAIAKCPAKDRPALVAEILHKTEKEERERCEQQLDAFKGLYDGLNAENKERMKRYPTLQSEGDVRACMGFMALLSLMQD